MLGGLGALVLNRSIRAQAQNDQPVVYLPVVSNGVAPESDPVFAGIGYSPFRDGQNPDSGPYPTLEQIGQDLDILSSLVLCPYFNQGDVTHIRTYGADHNLEKIPQVIQEKGSPLWVNAGCWLSGNLGANETSLTALIDEANRFANVTTVTVGNETQPSPLLTEQILIEYIHRVKNQIPQEVQVTTGETWYRWLHQPNLAANVDFILAHIYPYWETPPIAVEEAVAFLAGKYHELQNAYPDKKIVIGETGWPSAGEKRMSAVPSLINHNRYLADFVSWAKQEKVSYYLFEAFDENWKKKYEGEVGAHWGIFDAERQRKTTCQPL
jgi:exo-beta-1,3-glucanase (GH17 family)